MVTTFINLSPLMALFGRSQSLIKMKWRVKEVEPFWKWLILCYIFIRWSLTYREKQSFVQLISSIRRPLEMFSI